MRFSSPVTFIPTLALLLLSTKVVRVTALPSPLLGLVDDPVPLPSLPVDLPIPKGLRRMNRRYEPRESPKVDMRVSKRVKRSANDFAQPANVPMPLLKPREVDTQQGEKDEGLEDRRNCSEDKMHDCYVSHEKERVVERRAEKRLSLDTLLNNIPVVDTVLPPKGSRMVVRRR